ncbi:hypothetical protein BKA80DRAFT_328465, partial [Phyllosticta citrichinensis]
FLPAQACPARKHFFRTKWITASIILLSIYSTVFSGIFLGIAIRKPDWPQIHDKGALTPSNSSLLTAVFAKTIELSFATAVVSFIGQVLSRRSLSVRTTKRGVSLAEMNMRNWVTQPGNMVVNWETVRYASFSILGVISAIAAVCAMLYTSASDALVQPQIRFNHEHPINMFADVVTEWANPSHLQEQCKSPVPLSEDPVYRNSSCMDVSYASQGYHDYQQYLSEWAEWNGRIINNVTLAMPHISVLQAARNKENGILQPEDLGGLGAFFLTASTPNPAVHVLCANMNRTELAPMVYTQFPNAGELNTSTWPAQVSFYGNDTWLNSTVVDDLFRIGEKHGQHAPVFPRYPAEYNTVLNQTFSYGRVSIYVLARDSDPAEERYSMCQLKATITPMCSTKFVAMHDGSSLSVNCDPENDPMAYIKQHPDATSGWSTESRDWPWIASEWANSLSLGAGVTDGKASIARIITQTILRLPELDRTLPSIAEVLAVLAGSTLLMATEDSNVEMDWVSKSAGLKDPMKQMFNATILNRLYASGPSAVANNGFFIVLAGTFVLNVLCLAYFLFHRGLVTDFSEPPNLFSIAINSPPAVAMSGACGAGPAGSQWATDWCIGETGGHLFVLPREGLYNNNHNSTMGRSMTLGHPENFVDGGRNLHHHGHGILPLHLGRNDAHERLDGASTIPNPTLDSPRPPTKKPSKLQSLLYSMTHGFGGGASRGPASPASPSSPYMGGGGANHSAAELTEMSHAHRSSPSSSPVGLSFESPAPAPPALSRTGSTQSWAQEDTGYQSQSPRLVSSQTFSPDASKSPSLYSARSGTMGPGSSSGGLAPDAGGNSKITRAYSKLSKRKAFL